jgi:hypothetical protein
VRLLIGRGRFGACAAARVAGPASVPRTAAELDAIRGVHASAACIVAVHLNIATCGLMTCGACKTSVRDWHFGVDRIHVVHQLRQTTRSLVLIFLECLADDAPLDGLRSIFSLLQHFSKRYRCGMRASDMIEEMGYRGLPPPPPLHISLMGTYAVTQIPLNAPAAHLSRMNQTRGKAHLWLGRERA